MQTGGSRILLSLWFIVLTPSAPRSPNGSNEVSSMESSTLADSPSYDNGRQIVSNPVQTGGSKIVDPGAVRRRLSFSRTVQFSVRPPAPTPERTAVTYQPYFLLVGWGTSPLQYESSQLKRG